MPEPMPTGQRRIELQVREGLPELCTERRREMTQALEALVEDGTISSFTVTTQDKRTPVDSEDNRYVSFREWAREADVALSPSFGTRVCYCPEQRGYRTYDIAPAFCLVVYENDSIDAVYPHRDNGETKTVMDGIERLTARETLTPSRLVKSSAAD